MFYRTVSLIRCIRHQVVCYNRNKININTHKKLAATNTYLNNHQIMHFSHNSNKENMVVDFNYVKKVSSDKNVYIIDVRNPDEIIEHGKIPSSINIPLDQVKNVLGGANDFEKIFNRSKPSENSEIIFYCMIGKRSGMAQQNALNLGYKNAKNYMGSWTDWANQSK